jgi:hypothetical protein
LLAETLLKPIKTHLKTLLKLTRPRTGHQWLSPAVVGIVGVAVSVFERNVMPDAISRRGIRQLLAYRLQEILAGDATAIADREQA